MKNLFSPPKTCTGTLVGTNGNAFALLAQFEKCAKAAGWTKDEIKKVQNEAKKGDYDNLVSTLSIHLDD
ncbi:hypothetical protein [Comamonas sp.]|uniref:hypothetical protein n=1 Tax=Comamonas sp. TaxID=34028 RepID=UPI0012D0E6E7|nr:hypothetical protein [Comamonas sp.]MPS92939.1 hypothetical protein [Comamonas sp.]